MSVIFSEADKHFDPNKLDEKARFVYENSKKASSPDKQVSKDLGLDENKAKYKIEIILTLDRSSTNLCACAITPFRSGGALHGGGDEIMYFCRNEQNRAMGCGSILKSDVYMGRIGNEQVAVFYCDKCKRHVNREMLASTILYKLPVKSIAKNIYELFRQLDSNADIYLKHIKVDMRKAAEAKAKGMQTIKPNTELSIYTVKSIFKDVSNSSQILKKFEDFISV